MATHRRILGGDFLYFMFLFLFFASACAWGWLKSKTLVREESPPPPSPSFCRQRGRGGGGTSGDVLFPLLFCINQIMTLKSLQAAAVTTSKLRSPGLFTGSKPGNNGHRFSPEDAERKKKKKQKRKGRGCLCWLSHFMAPLCEVASSHFNCPLPWKVFHSHRFPFCLVCTSCSASVAAVAIWTFSKTKIYSKSKFFIWLFDLNFWGMTPQWGRSRCFWFQTATSTVTSSLSISGRSYGDLTPSRGQCQQGHCL